MNTNDLKKRISEEAQKKGISLTEDELNAKVLEASRMDSDKLERLSGGWDFVVCCDYDTFCWSDFLCITWDKGYDDK